MPSLEFVMAEHPPLADQPVLRLPPHSASTEFAFSTNPCFGHVGEAFIAQLSPAAPAMPNATPRGPVVVRIIGHSPGATMSTTNAATRYAATPAPGFIHAATARGNVASALAKCPRPGKTAADI